MNTIHTTLTNSDVAELTEWRRLLHSYPEVSGDERETAARVVSMLELCGPDEVLTDLGGHGVAAVFKSSREGPTLLLRCELDALPIEELGDLPHKSKIAGKGHLCGHDGHMAILMGVARVLGRKRPAQGRVVLLFQPAEEDGSGAAKVLEDGRFVEIAPDMALSLHNFPGIPLGHAVLAEGPMNCASRGMRIILNGRTAHASQPETGISPAPALARLLAALPELRKGDSAADPDFALVTITHATMGERAFGIAPGRAELWATLRTQKDCGMEALVTRAVDLVDELAAQSGLHSEISWQDVFHHCENHPDATRILNLALEGEDIPVTAGDLPMRGSEDFGRFGATASSAMFLLGSGEKSPALHNPDFDFPDTLTPIGTRVFIRAIDEFLC